MSPIFLNLEKSMINSNWFAFTSERFQDKTAIVDQTRIPYCSSFSYKELKDEVENLSIYLLSKYIKKKIKLSSAFLLIIQWNICFYF